MRKTLRMLLKKALPDRALNFVRQWRHARRREKIKAIPKLDRNSFSKILADDLGICKGATVFVHSGLESLNMDFPPQVILEILKDLVGNDGSLLFPVHIDIRAEDYLKKHPVFDVRRTPSFTGMISEIARRDKAACRSMHPTNSICAIGRNAEELVKAHHESIWPCGELSPYYRFMLEKDALIVGLGVTTDKLSFVHCVEDIMKDKFPVQTRKDGIFSCACIDAQGQRHDVRTLVAHERIQSRDVERFVAGYIPKPACADMIVMGHAFFRADAKHLFECMSALALEGITIYPKKIYRSRYR